LQTVYVLGADGKLQPVRVVTGISDGTYTEILSGPLAAGTTVVVGVVPKTTQALASPPPGLGGRVGGGGGGGRGGR
jgi:multidrug efflux pump subunit AcrA (membrane-fusion protein)